jgi:RHS repeat-associated protein
VCELDGSGSIVAVNTFGAQGLLSRHVTSTNASTFYTFDERGNVAQRTDSTGAVLSSDLYDAYGKRLSGGTSGDPWGFEAQAGYYTDAETGLVLCTHRYYDPQAGRFLTRDPIGYEGGIDLYGYTANDPVNEEDPDGLQGYKVADHNGSYLMDVPNGQDIDRNIREAMTWLKAHPGASLKAKYKYVADRVHGGANPTVGDYKDYKDVHCDQLRQERDLAGNFNFGALSAAMGFSETANALAGHIVHVKDTYGSAGGGLNGLKAVLADPFHPDDRQQAVEDGAEYYYIFYQHISGRNTLISVTPVK